MLKEKIQSDFIVAMKNKDTVSKTALSGIKSKITEEEKSKGNVELTDDQIIKVIASGIKQRRQSYDEFIKGNRIDLAEKESAEILVLENYMPKQMTLEELENILTGIILEVTTPGINNQKLVGQTIGTFNKRYISRADNTLVKQVTELLINKQ